MKDMPRYTECFFLRSLHAQDPGAGHHLYRKKGFFRDSALCLAATKEQVSEEEPSDFDPSRLSFP
jgi:hypothetical protein